MRFQASEDFRSLLRQAADSDLQQPNPILIHTHTPEKLFECVHPSLRLVVAFLVVTIARVIAADEHTAGPF